MRRNINVKVWLAVLAKTTIRVMNVMIPFLNSGAVIIRRSRTQINERPLLQCHIEISTLITQAKYVFLRGGSPIDMLLQAEAWASQGKCDLPPGMDPKPLWSSHKVPFKIHCTHCYRAWNYPLELTMYEHLLASDHLSGWPWLVVRLSLERDSPLDSM